MSSALVRLACLLTLFGCSPRGLVRVDIQRAEGFTAEIASVTLSSAAPGFTEATFTREVPQLPDVLKVGVYVDDPPKDFWIVGEGRSKAGERVAVGTVEVMALASGKTKLLKLVLSPAPPGPVPDAGSGPDASADTLPADSSFPGDALAVDASSSADARPRVPFPRPDGGFTSDGTSCGDYCQLFFEGCNADREVGNGAVYDSPEHCLTVCRNLYRPQSGAAPPQDLACRLETLRVIQPGTPGVTQCREVVPAGTGCSSACAAYCTVATRVCPGEVPDASTCATRCTGEQWPIAATGTPGDTSGNTIVCRLDLLGREGPAACAQITFPPPAGGTCQRR